MTCLRGPGEGKGRGAAAVAESMRSAGWGGHEAAGWDYFSKYRGLKQTNGEISSVCE